MAIDNLADAHADLGRAERLLGAPCRLGDVVELTLGGGQQFLALMGAQLCQFVDVYFPLMQPASKAFGSVSVLLLHSVLLQ